MPILFSVVAQEENIIANFASCDGNFIEIIRQVLPKLALCTDKMTYYHGPYLIHYILEDNHLYFCITDKTCQRSRAFLFLNQIHRRFIAVGKDQFVKVLADEMYRYSEDYSTITIRKGELDQLNNIGVESSETILGEKVLFVNNTENLSYASVTYVGKTPEKVYVSEEKSKADEENSIAYEDKKESRTNGEKTKSNADKFRAYFVVIIGVLMMFASGTVYFFGPVSCIIVTAVIAYCFFSNLKSQPSE